MNFFEKITGSDMTKEMKGFEARAKVLPANFKLLGMKLRVISGVTEISLVEI